MALFYLIRHGKPDYTYGDTHGFIGQGHDLAPLQRDKRGNRNIERYQIKKCTNYCIFSIYKSITNG